jgi:hypothetical protein
VRWRGRVLRSGFPNQHDVVITGIEKAALGLGIFGTSLRSHLGAAAIAYALMYVPIWRVSTPQAVARRRAWSPRSPLKLKARANDPIASGTKQTADRRGDTIFKYSQISKKHLVLAFVIASISDAIGAFVTPLPPIGWVADIATALLLFLVLGRQWLLLPGLVLEAIPGVGVLPFWLLVVGAIAVLGTPRPRFERH